MSLDAWIDLIFGNKMFDNVVDIVTFNNINYNDLSLGVRSIYSNILLPIGLSLLVLYFLIELMEKTTHDNFNIEHMIKMFIKLVIGATLMNNGLVILDGIRAFGNFITSEIVGQNQGGIGANGVDVEALKREVADYGFLDKILARVNLIIPYVCSFIVSIAVQVVCWSRTIELLMRTMMAPIAMSDIFADGLRSGGFRYLKKYLATILQGTVILGIVVIMSSINAVLMNLDYYNSLNQIPGTFYINTLVVSFATVSLIMKSKEWANDAVGM